MQSQQIRIKVSIEKLLIMVKEARTKAEQENAAIIAKEVQRFAEWQRKAHLAIDRQNINEFESVPSWGPMKLPSLSGFDRDIKLLELAADSEIVITSSSNFLKYL